MRKRWMSLLLAGVLVMSIAGCGKKSDLATPKEDSANTNSSADDSINFLIMPDIEAIQPVFDMYQEQSNTKVNVESLPFDKMFEAIEVRLGAKEDSVDVLLVDAPMIANYTAKGYLADMSEYVSEDSKKNITETSLGAGMVDGQLTALPLNSSCVNLYYNKEIFEENGIEPPSNDVNERWTWEKVVEVAKELTYEKDGKQIYGLSFEQIGRPYQLLPLAQSLGAEKFVSDDGLTTDGYTNSEEMVEACQFYYDTFNTWKISPKISADDSVGYFTGGQIAMFVAGPWQIPNFEAAGMDFGFAPHPYFEGGEAVTPTGSWYVGVSNYSKNKEAAAKFVEYLTTNNEACQENYNIGANLPCNISVLEKIEEDSAYDEFPKNSMKLAVYEAMNTAQARPQMAGYAEWQSVMEKTYSDIMNGSEPKKALDAAVSEIDNQLKKYQR